jgi:excisionase family DNA binding protein
VLPARRLLKEREAAVYLGIGERTLRTWEALGRVRACRMGRTKRFDVHDLEQLIERAKAEGVP